MNLLKYEQNCIKSYLNIVLLLPFSIGVSFEQTPKIQDFKSDLDMFFSLFSFLIEFHAYFLFKQFDQALMYSEIKPRFLDS